MQDELNQQPEFKREAEAIVARLGGPEREALLLKCWMSHDARWFMAVAQAFGLEAASRLNQAAAREDGKVEARRVLRALDLPNPATLAEALVVQEVLASLLTRDLVEYHIVSIGEDAFQFRIGRCFAHENVTRAGVGGEYECGIFARVAGWWEAFELPFEMAPPLGRCLKALGQECAFTFSVAGHASARAGRT
jgi:hypothetical protein